MLGLRRIRDFLAKKVTVSVAALKGFLRRRGLRRPSELYPKLRRFVQRRVLRKRYHAFGLAELHAALDRVGIHKGSTVFVHSAWDEFYNFEGEPLTLIKALQEHVGPEGTIAMPAYPMHIDETKLFDVRRTPTGAGLVPELFRRMRGTRRSINLYQSVAANGHHAPYLTSAHQQSVTPWDRHSPYARLADVDATILCLGLPSSFGLGTSMHCAESLLFDEIPYYKQVFSDPVIYHYRDQDGGEGIHSLRKRTGKWVPGRVLRHIDPREVRVTYLSNVRIQAISARYLVDRMVALARQGIVNYYWPWPKKRFFQVSGQSTIK